MCASRERVANPDQAVPPLSAISPKSPVRRSLSRTVAVKVHRLLMTGAGLMCSSLCLERTPPQDLASDEPQALVLRLQERLEVLEARDREQSLLIDRHAKRIAEKENRQLRQPHPTQPSEPSPLPRRRCQRLTRDTRPQTGNEGRTRPRAAAEMRFIRLFGGISDCLTAYGFSEAWLRCPMCQFRKGPWPRTSARAGTPLAHRSPGDSLAVCFPAEPASASPGKGIATDGCVSVQPLDIGEML